MMKHHFLTACLYALCTMGATASPGQTVLQTLQFHPDEGMQGWTTADADADGELYDAIQKKMTINFNRSWKKQANGSYHH